MVGTVRFTMNNYNAVFMVPSDIRSAMKFLSFWLLTVVVSSQSNGTVTRLKHAKDQHFSVGGIQGWDLGGGIF